MTQLDLFDLLYEDYNLPNDRPIRLIESFAGIGTQRMGFERVGIDVDVIGIIEVDKDAIKSYASMHTNYLDVRDTWFYDKEITKEEMIKKLQDKMVGYDFKNSKHTITESTNIEKIKDYYLADELSKNYGDISKVSGKDLPREIDMFTYSFPCTDLSKAGLQKGLGGTRSGLVYEVFRIVEELKNIGNKPKTLIMENVIDLVQSKFILEFGEMQLMVEKYGYINYTFRMNAKDYGIPQRRERVFMVSIPSKHNYTKPSTINSNITLSDMLETDVDEKYYLSEKGHINIMGNAINKELKDHYNREEAIISPSISQTITTKMDRRVGDSTYILEGYTDLKVKDYLIIKEATNKGYDIAMIGDSVSLDQPKSKTRRGRVGKMESSTLTTSCNVGVVTDDLKIRKLTPKECWRLMGIDDCYYEMASKVVSDTQLYKQAGNAIVVDVFGLIVKQLTERRVY